MGGEFDSHRYRAATLRRQSDSVKPRPILIQSMIHCVRARVVSSPITMVHVMSLVNRLHSPGGGGPDCSIRVIFLRQRPADRPQRIDFPQRLSCYSSVSPMLESPTLDIDIDSCWHGEPCEGIIKPLHSEGRSSGTVGECPPGRAHMSQPVMCETGTETETETEVSANHPSRRGIKNKKK